MSADSKKRSEEFLKIAGQFKLGVLATEASHPVTANLSEIAARDIPAALNALFEVDGDVVRKFRDFVESERAGEIAKTILGALKAGGRIFFTGCGATGRLSILLDSIWRDFWHRQKDGDWEDRTLSVMSGGDFALIKSVEGFEDIGAFGKKQLNDLGVSNRDVVFAITEGGETSFVIGTAWAGIAAGAKVYFVYNNPDEVLCEHVERSREVIRDSRIEKINLTTGPMAIAGSTRMQATSIQLCVMLAIFEAVAREARGENGRTAPREFLEKLEELHENLKSPKTIAALAKIVALEESAYRAGGKCNYFADGFGIDVLTDTTERSPTFCTPPFRKFDDPAAAESLAYLFVPEEETAGAWRRILRREPRCVEWRNDEIRELVRPEDFLRRAETIRRIGRAELMRFKFGLDGLAHRPLKPGDCAIAILSETDMGVLPMDRFFDRESARNAKSNFRSQLQEAREAGARTGLVYFHSRDGGFPEAAAQADAVASIFVPPGDFLFEGLARVAVKLVMNAISTCTMVRLGRVMGNMMIYVVPGNLKLVDRATRYVCRLANLPYDRANELLFEVIEFIEPRMKLDRAYPPVVGIAVVRARQNCSNEAAEKFLQEG